MTMTSGSSRRAPLIYEAAFAFVDEFDGVLNGKDMVVAILVRVVNHGRQRGRLARASGTGNQHQALVHHRKFAQHGGQRGVKFLKVLEG